MGGGSKKAGVGGGGGGAHKGRYCDPTERKVLSKDPGVPGLDLKRVAGRLMKKETARIQRREDAKAQRYARAGITPSGHGAADDGSVVEETEAEKRSEYAAFALTAKRKQVEYGNAADTVASALHRMVPGSSAAAGGDDTVVERCEISLRRFFKQFKKVLDEADVLLEVLDARDPLGCRLLNIEKSIESQFGDSKPMVIILNKIDLLPSTDVLASWVEYFRLQGKLAIPFTATDHGSLAPASSASGHATTYTKNSCIQTLLAALRKIARHGIGALLDPMAHTHSDAGRKAIGVGVIGYPNVGKSSIINALKRKSVVGVGNTPGFTTGTQIVDLRSDVKVIDCPGVVMPGEDTGDVALRNAVRVDQLVDPVAAVARLIARCDALQLIHHFGIADNILRQSNAARFVELFVKAVGLRRGRVGHGGDVNEDDAARLILKEWNDGRMGYYTLPPDSDPHAHGRPKLVGGADDGVEEEDGDDDGVQIMSRLDPAASIYPHSDLPTFHLSASKAELDAMAFSAKTKRHGGLAAQRARFDALDAHQAAHADAKRQARKVQFNPLDALDDARRPTRADGNGPADDDDEDVVDDD